MNEKELKQLEEQQSFEGDSNDVPPSDIVAFNELRSCADLLRLHLTGQLDIRPDFQREIVWSPPAQTRFIDSLTKQLPIPSMCISLDYKTNKRLVIDGLQRMQSIINFLSEDEFKLSDLDDIDERIAGKTVYTIKTKAKDIYERVQNVTIPITVIRCDTSNPAHNEYLFTIFHRLNSGGARLSNQEIRNCIYSGPFNNLLKTIVKSEEWKRFVDFKPDRIYRMANEEIILRVLAFTDSLALYNGRLSKFLNDYMERNRNLAPELIEHKRDTFLRTINLLLKYAFEDSNASSLGKTSLEGLLYGVMVNIKSLEEIDSPTFKKCYEKFSSLVEFSLDSLKEGLSGKEKVKGRLHSAELCFKIE